MSPPLYIRFISTFLSTVVMAAGIRNVISPGTPLSIIPEDDIFQAHFHAGWTTSEQEKTFFIFKLLGCFMISLSLVKLSMVHYISGTFLRRNLFIILGLTDILTAHIVYSYKGLPQSTLLGFAALHAIEGVVFVGDAVLRPRQKKFAGKGNKLN
mmetsp:Transcript_21058/g.43920  ORF Transcript_21058/g.43920 Transcript_21058/m.43920 type:complete len:154 (-) Transcript_21058:17-478(-)